MFFFSVELPQEDRYTSINSDNVNVSNTGYLSKVVKVNNSQELSSYILNFIEENSNTKIDPSQTEISPDDAALGEYDEENAFAQLEEIRKKLSSFVSDQDSPSGLGGEEENLNPVEISTVERKGPSHTIHTKPGEQIVEVYVNGNRQGEMTMVDWTSGGEREEEGGEEGQGEEEEDEEVLDVEEEQDSSSSERYLGKYLNILVCVPSTFLNYNIFPNE